MQAQSRWPHRLCPAFGRQQWRLAIPGRSKLLRRRGFCDAGLCGQCLDVRHRHADALIQAVQPLVPVPQHACANRVETRGVLHVLDYFRNGGCHRRADPVNEFTLARLIDAQKYLQPPPCAPARAPCAFVPSRDPIVDNEQDCAAWVLTSWYRSDQSCRHRQSAPCPPWPTRQRPGQS